MRAASRNGCVERVSPRFSRARCSVPKRTCELAGFESVAQIDPDLVEWNYGEYEGRMTADIHKERPDWQVFRDGCPRGESPNEVGARADRAIKRLRAVEGNVLLSSSGHFLRVLAARCLGLEPSAVRGRKVTRRILWLRRRRLLS